jgi:hypothetical protein
MDAIVYDEIFANNAVTGRAQIDVVGGASAGDGLVLATTGQKIALEIKFDAASGAYTLTGPAISQIFAPADAEPADNSGFTHYRKAGTDQIDYLSLQSTNVLHYVRTGYWQRNTRTLTGQADIAFTPFAYGMATAAANVPRSGYGGYAVGFFGFFTPLGSAPKVLQGAGEFRADFASGLYLTNGKAYEYHLLVDYHVGQYDWVSTGAIASAGGFSGPFVYRGAYGNTATGVLTGRFYGPNGEEVGAAATGATSTGASLSAVLTGKSSSTVVRRDLTNQYAEPFRFYALHAPVTVLTFADGTSTTIGGYITNGANVSRAADGTYTLDLSNPPAGGPQGIFGPSTYVPAKSDARVTVYETGSERLTLYNPRHPDLNLTYASFGMWQATGSHPGTTGRFDRDYFAYGSLPTPPDSLARTGAAQYVTRLMGWAVNLVDARQFEVSGDMTFGVDFGTMKFDGALNARGADAANGQLRDFGSYSFAGTMDTAYNYQASLSGNSIGGGRVEGRIYGPNGEETAASFEIITRNPTTSAPIDFVKGLAIGKRQ